jgi:hypothetical protein
MKKDDPTRTIEFGFKERILQCYFMHQRKIHSYIAVTLGFAVLVIGYFSSGPGVEDTICAKKLFETWKKNPLDQDLREEMAKTLKKIDGLERAKESEIVQTLLLADQIESAEPLARQCIERLRKHSPFHAAYSEASLCIERQQFQKGLELAVALKEQIDRDPESEALKGKNLQGGATIYVSNLLRIALLQKQIGNIPGELSAWKELREVLNTEDKSVAAQLLEANFGQSGFSFADFIEQREESLQSFD